MNVLHLVTIVLCLDPWTMGNTSDEQHCVRVDWPMARNMYIQGCDDLVEMWNAPRENMPPLARTDPWYTHGLAIDCKQEVAS